MIKGKFSRTVKWEDIDKTGSKLEDLSNVPAPTTSNTVLIFNGTNYEWGILSSGSSNIKVYQSGTNYSKDDLIINPERNTLYIALKDFTATDIITDENNGNIKAITSTNAIAYKQVEYTASAGDSVTINLTIPNENRNRHVFVLKKQSAPSADIEPFSFDSSDTHWNYDIQNVIMDGTVYLKNSETSSMTAEGIYFKSNINTTQYKDIVRVDVVFL